MPKSRQIIGHSVDRARDVVGLGQVAIVTLVKTIEA
jgi:hypothetical protein